MITVLLLFNQLQCEPAVHLSWTNKRHINATVIIFRIAIVSVI